MMKQTKEEKINSVKQIGKEINFEFQISPQAKKIIDSFDDFPIDHFKKWWKENYGIITGTHLHHYFSTSNGIETTKTK